MIPNKLIESLVVNSEFNERFGFDLLDFILFHLLIIFKLLLTHKQMVNQGWEWVQFCQILNPDFSENISILLETFRLRI